MKYVLLAYRDEKMWVSMSPSDRAIFEQACQSSELDLIHSHHLLDAYSLQDNTALTVRIEEGTAFVNNGPITKGQEQLFQLLFLQARDLNAAIQIASKMPQIRGGPIEVRPLVE